MLSVRLPAATVQRIRELADAHDTSQSNIITMAVEAMGGSVPRPGAEAETKEVVAVLTPPLPSLGVSDYLFSP